MTDKAERPTKGGSYTRMPDGTLTRAAYTRQVGSAEHGTPNEPVPPKPDPKRKPTDMKESSDA